MPTRDEILARLQELAEPEYARFASSLIPDCPPMLGVRLPALRHYARALAADPAASLAALGTGLFEERMLRGMVISYARLSDESRRDLLEQYLPLADNWSLCDSVAAGCKWMAKTPAFWLPWLRELARREEEFSARFGLVCLLDHFTATPEGRRQTLQACGALQSRALYARLGAAWAVSIVAVKEPDLGLAFLTQPHLDNFTQNKAIQKICESRRATPAYRQAVRQLRR